MERLVLLFNAMLCFLTYTHGFTEPYVGRGVLQQIPPSIYYGGVIEVQHPPPGAPIALPAFFSDYTVKTNPGWKTQFILERIEILPATDTIEFKVGNYTDSPTEVFYTASSGSGGQVVTVTDERVDVSIRFFGFSPSGPRKVRIRWISTPSTPAQVDMLTLDNLNQSVITWNESLVDSVLLNLVDDGGIEWQVNTSAGLVTLQPGAQHVSTSSPLYIQPVDPQAKPTDFLLEWFPFVTGNHIQSNGEGCISYINQEITVNSWTLKPPASGQNRSSLKIIFSNVTANSADFQLLVEINGGVYMRSTHSMSQVTYYIPVEWNDEVVLRLATTSKQFTLVLCYEGDNRTQFYATGYFRSVDYPEQILSGTGSAVEGFPLPPNWSLTLTVENIGIEFYRSWLDLILLNGNLKKYAIQTYTGASEVYGNKGGYHRYSDKIHIWQGYCTDFGVFGGNLYKNEVLLRFQSSLGVGRPQPWTGYSIMWEARLQTADEGKDTLYFTGESGTISSPNYPNNYHSDTRTVFDISVFNSSLYNAIEFTYGESYTEPDTDIITMWEHVKAGELILISLPARVQSGDMTGQVFTYLSPRITVRFDTNLHGEYKGFTINWRAVYIDENATTSASTTVSSTSTTTPDQEEVTSEYITTDIRFIGWVGGLGVAILILIIALAVALMVIMKYRKKLSDVQSKGFFTPKYSTTEREVAD